MVHREMEYVTTQHDHSLLMEYVTTQNDHSLLNNSIKKKQLEPANLGHGSL